MISYCLYCRKRSDLKGVDDVRVSPADVKDILMSVVDELSTDRVAEVLEFALFMKARQAQQRSGCEPVQRLEDLWGDFWPEDESVDDFISTCKPGNGSTELGGNKDMGRQAGLRAEHVSKGATRELVVEVGSETE